MAKELKKYLAYDAINGWYEDCSTIEEAQKFLEDSFMNVDEGYAAETEQSQIFELKQVVKLKVIDKKENYKYIDIDDAPDDVEVNEEEEVWPYGNHFDAICEHKFVDVNTLDDNSETNSSDVKLKYNVTISKIKSNDN